MMKPTIITTLEKDYKITLMAASAQDAVSAMLYEHKKPEKGVYFIENGQVVSLNLTELPLETFEVPAGLSSLRFLDVSDCGNLKALTFERSLPYLETLDISDSKVERLDFGQGYFSLKRLDVSRNGLQSIHLEGDMPELESLDLSGNQLAEFTLPTIFERLKYLYLKGNELRNIPKEIYDKNVNCWEQIRSYLESSLLTGDVLNTAAKVIFFGNGRVGKTTLSHQFRKGVFKAWFDPTHGIMVEEWEIKRKDFPLSLKTKIQQQINQHKQGPALKFPSTLQIQLWDFGGQEYFHATHRLFLNNNVLYLLVWDINLEKQDESKGNYPKSFWQKNINHYAPENTTFQIQNKETGETKTNYQNKVYKISNYDNDKKQYEKDIEVLKKAIFEELPNLQYLCEPIPKLYHQIREELRRVQIREKKRFLTYIEYRTLCQKMDETAKQIMQEDSHIKTLTDFLHNTGSLICYRFRKDVKERLKEYVFIDPKWVTETIYQILDKETLINNGEFDKKHIQKVLKEHHNVIQDSKLWVDLMTEFELIFNKNDDATTFIAPQYLPPKCKDLSEKAFGNLKEELPYILELHYPDFMSRSIIGRFICKYGNLAKDYYWKYGIVVHSNLEKALVTCDYERKTIRIQTKDLCSSLSKELFETLRKIDPTEHLEVCLSDKMQADKLWGPVNVQKLENQSSQEGRKFIEWKGKDFDLTCFSALFRHSEMKIIDPPILIPITKLIEVPNSKETESTIPFVSVNPIKGEKLIERQKRRRSINSRKKSRKVNIIDIPMDSGARDFVPFDQIKDKKNILFLSATPSYTGQLNTGKESRIKELFKLFPEKLEFNFIEEHGVDADRFDNFAMFNNPQILHYAGHGEIEGILLENEDYYESEDLVNLIRTLNNLQCVILNACYSLSTAEMLAAHIPYVIGTQDAFDDKAAIAFAHGFYVGILSNQPIEKAFEFGIHTIQRKKLPDADVPVLVRGVKKD